MTVGARRRVLSAAAARMLDRAARSSGSRVGAVLLYHRIDDQPGNRLLELSAPVGLDDFESHLDVIRRQFRAVTASEIAQAAATRQRGEPFPVAITFDDDLRSHVDVALGALRRAEVTATFFLTGTGLRSTASFWWNDLQLAVDTRTVLPADFPTEVQPLVQNALARQPRAIHQAAAAIEAMSPVRRSVVARMLRQRVPHQPERVLGSDDVAQLARAGFEIGFHTLRHDALPPLDDESLAAAMVDGRDALETATGGGLETIAYPHGKADARVADAARAADFHFGFTDGPGLVATGSDPLLLPRWTPPADADAFAAALSRSIARALLPREPRTTKPHVRLAGAAS
jgi:peptidoglycan/xylan/chitin deacetylase (PgdA/CDA1 family)